MKKILGIILAVMMLATVAFASNITVTLNGTAIDFADQPATIVDGRTLVPLRAIFEALGASVEWDQATKTVTSAMDDTTVKLTIGDNNLYKNDEAVTLDVPAQIINSRTMVPARAIAEAYGVDVQWDSATRTVVLTKEEKKAEVPTSSVVIYSEAYSTGTEGLQTVKDPTNAANDVYFMQSNSGEATNWTYFWIPGSFFPGERYLVEFDVYLDTDALGNDITDKNSSIGVCFSYGDFFENAEGNVAHHGNTIDGKESKVTLTPKKWTHVKYIYEIPETINMDSKMDFGIYGNPVTVPGYYDMISVNFYLDNVTVDIYEGAASNGLHAGKISDEATVIKPIDEYDGIIYDFAEDTGNLSFSNANEVENGVVVFNCTGDNDPRITDPTVKFDADEYVAVVAKLKYENFVPADKNSATNFGVYFATTADPELSQSKFADTKYKNYTSDDDGWYTVYVDMTQNQAWTGEINTIRFDPINGEGIITIDKIVVVKK